jgi:hypothetical protein
MCKVTIEIEDGFKDGQKIVRTVFKPDFQGASPDAPPTDAMLCAYVMQELWSKGTWKGLAQSMCPDVFAYRARLAAAQAANNDAPSGVLDPVKETATG